MEALDYMIAVRRWRRLPWRVGASSLRNPGSAPAPRETDEDAPGLLAYLIAAVLRILLGAGVGAAVTQTITSGASAWLIALVGATAPHVLEKVTLFVPLVIRVGREGIAAVQAQAAMQQQPTSPAPLAPQPLPGLAGEHAATIPPQDPGAGGM
ncbi:hypothetical protein GCM10022233_65550 [Streptomyces shaanxiensis]|uniref:Uncharacterized protein n=1 Tax=Streptomyces shaanxiensis TaxID=653357 RepID=A0ABP7VYW0_9ACTN